MAGDDAYGATIAKRKLARVLTELRKETGMTANQVCDKLGWGRGKVGRFESNIWRRPEMSDLRDLLRLYGVNDGDQQRLEALAMLARNRPWWRDHPDVFTNEFPGFENDAAAISVYMPLVLPGLVQIPDYIRAHQAVGVKSADWREQSLATRLRRQQILERTDGTAPRLCAVITEASLLYRWGTASQRRSQINHLIALAHRPDVEIRLFRLADGPHPGMASLINIFEFPDPGEPPMVYLENDVAIQEVTEPEDVDAYTETYKRIREAAKDPDSTIAYLNKLRSE